MATHAGFASHASRHDAQLASGDGLSPRRYVVGRPMLGGGVQPGTDGSGAPAAGRAVLPPLVVQYVVHGGAAGQSMLSSGFGRDAHSESSAGTAAPLASRT